jgi:hypothetical protein
MPVLESGYSEYLFTIAQCYLGLGYSVLPVYGDLDISRAKVCPIPWTYYQQRRATLADLRSWFKQHGYGGLAIVTGRISGLIALDFDDSALAQDFARRFPDLTETWTVQSGGRKLPHYYYRLPLNHNINSQRREGVDLQSGGRYVVAPPTSIAGSEWRVLNGGQPKMLTERDLRRISGFMGVTASESSENPANPPVFAFLSRPGNVQQPSPSGVEASSVSLPGDLSVTSGRMPPPSGDSNSLVSRYLKLSRSGRNEALFQTAIWARDHGWHEDDVKRCLVGPHVRAISTREHHAESPEQRHKEAVRTIESAFSRPPRVLKARNEPASSSGFNHAGIVSNAVREALLRRKETATLRVLEALSLAGWQPGQFFTEREARETARRYAVGDWSVRKALHHTELFKSPEPEASSPAKYVNTAVDTQNTEYKKCFFVTLPKPTKNQRRGRPVRYYVMPDQETLSNLLEVQPAPATRIAAEDLHSCRTYRQAALRELVKRRPGNYSREWLADFLGVSVTTTRRYTKDASFTVMPTYHESPLLWRNVDSLIPPDIHNARPGSFLEDANGKKYPPIRPVARRLLGQSRYVWFKWRGVNHYAYAKSGDENPVSTSRSVSQNAPQPLPTHPKSRIVSASSGVAPPETARVLQSTPAPPPDYTHPLSDARLEAAARRVYQNVSQLDSRRTLSLANARSLVIQYGELAVENMVNTMEQRGNIRNPAGFLTRMLASQYGFMTEDSLTIAEIYAAERAFLVTRELNPRCALSWPNACKLAREYGQVAIENAIKLLCQRPVKNPAGYLVKLLRSEPSLASFAYNQTDRQFIEHVYTTLRQMNPQRALSRKLVQRLVAARGRQAVSDALHLIKQRGNVQNPAGFLITLLRAQDVVRKPKSQTSE